MKVSRFFLYIIPSFLAVCACSALRGSSEDEYLEYQDPEEYVSDGYSTIRKDESTSAASRVVPDKDVYNYRTIMEYLDGRVAGVTVEGGRAFIRGNKEEALYVVDGMEVSDISFLNPADVRSVDVLKGPEASIYGLRGKNGVIVISTKTAADGPRKKSKKANVTVNASTGFRVR